jgi:hypothetical protein
MMKMHVFVDKQGSMIAAAPAPETLSGGTPAIKTPGPVFAGSSPASDADGVQGYELEIEESLLAASRDSFGAALQARLSEAIRTQRGVKPITISR